MQSNFFFICECGRVLENMFNNVLKALFSVGLIFFPWNVWFAYKQLGHNLLMIKFDFSS